MNGNNEFKLPKFMEGEPLPAGYYDAPNPYAEPPISKYNIRAMGNYAIASGKKISELTKEEASRFLVNKTY